MKVINVDDNLPFLEDISDNKIHRLFENIIKTNNSIIPLDESLFKTSELEDIHYNSHVLVKDEKFNWTVPKYPIMTKVQYLAAANALRYEKAESPVHAGAHIIGCKFFDKNYNRILISKIRTPSIYNNYVPHNFTIKNGTIKTFNFSDIVLYCVNPADYLVSFFLSRDNATSRYIWPNFYELNANDTIKNPIFNDEEDKIIRNGNSSTIEYNKKQ